METYQGVKFNHEKRAEKFSFDERLTKLNRTAYLFSQLGLTPVHPEGAYGNQSYRTSESSFIITKSGMTPTRELEVENYCEIVAFESHSNTFISRGVAKPSSESFLHNEIYNALPNTAAILHGHSNILNEFTAELGIPVTSRFYDYGTMELAQSGLEIACKGIQFFILKDHGFVALGSTIKSAERLVLDYYQRLITILKDSTI